MPPLDSDAGVDMNEVAVDAGSRSADNRLPNYGNVVEVQSQNAGDYNTATRLLERRNVSVAPLVLTWNGQLLTTTTNSLWADTSPKLRVVASAGSARIEYLFDAVPGGEFSFNASELTVDVVWDVTVQRVMLTGLVPTWRRYVDSVPAAQTGRYSVSAFVREGTGRNVAQYTQQLSQSVSKDALQVTVPAPHWATEFAPVAANGDFSTPASDVRQATGYSVRDFSSVLYQIAVYGSADLDRYALAGVTLPVLGDCVIYSSPTTYSSVVWVAE